MSAVMSQLAHPMAVELEGGTLRLRLPEQQRTRLTELCGFASRQNPKRAFLFVSKVLGKHIPVKPFGEPPGAGSAPRLPARG